MLLILNCKAERVVSVDDSQHSVSRLVMCLKLWVLVEFSIYHRASDLGAEHPAWSLHRRPSHQTPVSCKYVSIHFKKSLQLWKNISFFVSQLLQHFICLVEIHCLPIRTVLMIFPVVSTLPVFTVSNNLSNYILICNSYIFLMACMVNKQYL